MQLIVLDSPALISGFKLILFLNFSQCGFRLHPARLNLSNQWIIGNRLLALKDRLQIIEFDLLGAANHPGGGYHNEKRRNNHSENSISESEKSSPRKESGISPI